MSLDFKLCHKLYQMSHMLFIFMFLSQQKTKFQAYPKQNLRTLLMDRPLVLSDLSQKILYMASVKFKVTLITQVLFVNVGYFKALCQ